MISSLAVIPSLAVKRGRKTPWAHREGSHNCESPNYHPSFADRVVGGVVPTVTNNSELVMFLALNFANAS